MRSEGFGRALLLVAALAGFHLVPLLRAPLLPAGLEPPEVERGAAPFSRADAVVWLTAEGRLSLDGDETTLEGLTSGLERLAAAAGFEEPLPWRISRARLLLAVDRRAPWAHACWLMIAAAEAKIPRLLFAADGGGRAVPVGLPRDGGVVPCGEPIEGIRIEVVVAREGYVCGERRGGVAELRLWIDEARRAGKPVVGRLRAAPTLPFGPILAAAGEMVSAGIAPVLRSAGYAGSEIRRVRPLPAPPAPQPGTTSRPGGGISPVRLWVVEGSEIFQEEEEESPGR